MAIISDPLATISYCGPPPSPASLVERWNLDPVLIAALAGLALLYVVGAARRQRAGTGPKPLEKVAFWTGWAITTLALVSPLCPLSVSLFAARVGQHMILTLIAAPLVVAGRPLATWAAAFGADLPESRWLCPAPLPATAAFGALLWFWHAPGPYAATFASTAIYWTMHLSLFGAALWLWHGLFDTRPATLIARIAAGVISSAQMGLLGALITLAPRPLYAPHALTTVAWGLGPLQDQQLGGGIMWVPGCLVVLVLSLLSLWPALSDPEPQRVARG